MQELSIRRLVSASVITALLCVPASARGGVAVQEAAEGPPAAASVGAGTDASAEAQRLVLSPPDRVLRRRAIGLGVAAGVFGVAWMAMKGTSTSSDISLGREIESGRFDPDECVESCSIGPLFNGIGAVLLVGSAAFLGSSLHAHGRRLGRQDRGLGRSVRTGRIVAGVGGGLIASGLALLTVGLVTGSGSGYALKSVGVREMGWWSVTVLGLSGAALAGFGHGIVRGKRERGSAARVTFMPTLSRTGFGVALLGRF